ncbi:MAG: ABC transporter permease DevC [Oculatellaceae cyanobacterium bins.114]|nr:ABC transporter permease DevC [Oculatellaceae cyanobacterium bins.114]
MFLKSLNDYYRAHKPLAWAQLSHQKMRLAVAMTGVAFSNILIFTQLGLRALLFDGITLVPQNLNGDLFLVSAYAPTIDFGSFPKIYLYQADAIAGVATASPLYIGSAPWVNPEDFARSAANHNLPKPETQAIDFFPNTVKILAFNPVQPVFNTPEINQQLKQLNVPGGVLFDRLSQSQLGPVPALFEQQGGVTTVMQNRRAYVVGLFSLGSTFFDKGHVVMSDWNYALLNGQASLNQVTVGVLTVEPGQDIATVQKRLQANLPEAVRVMTREELLAAEQNFRATFPEGKILNFGAAIGFIVGVVIVYQVLYTDVSDHLPEYATLKAMGYSDVSLLSVVLQEAVILAVLGFIPGYFTSLGMYSLLTTLTRIPLTMRPEIALQVFMLTLVMCIISGAIAMNKLRSADPADVF